MTSLPGDTLAPPLIGLLQAPRAAPGREGPGPDDAQLAVILEAATTVPDHGTLRPWRFVVVRDSGRDRFGEALVAGLLEERGPDLPESVLTKMRMKAFAAPLLVMLVASPRTGSNVPVWEQVASASCTGYAMVLAATALGLGAIWKSAPVLHTRPVRALFGARARRAAARLGQPGSRRGSGAPGGRRPGPPPAT